MRKPSAILFLSLMLIPLSWNGINLMHYLVEHTHAFCTSEKDHRHTSTEDCKIICPIASQYDQGQISRKIEFQELRKCIKTFVSFRQQDATFNPHSTQSNHFLHYGRLLSKNIFRPPIS